MSSFTVVLDACVLYPAELRSLLMYLAKHKCYRAKWTNQIHDEWIRNVLKNHREVTSEKLERTRQLMDLHARDALVEGYESLINSLQLPDPDDRHVLAAAIKCHADAIVTWNLKDFPVGVLNQFDIEAIDPDDFLDNQFDLSDNLVCRAVNEHLLGMTNPPFTVTEYLSMLERQGLTKFVSSLRHYEEFFQTSSDSQ